MLEHLRSKDYISYRDAAVGILGRHSGEDALAAFGLDDLFATTVTPSDLVPVYAFLEAQGYQCAVTPALGLLGLVGCVEPGPTVQLLGSLLGTSQLYGVPGRLPSATVVVDRPGVGLLALADITPAIRSQAHPVADEYVTVIDAGLAAATTLVPEEKMNGRRASSQAITHLGAAAELLGVVDRLLDDATHYAQQRRQFGRTIASNQAIQHLLAWAATERHQLMSLLDIAIARSVDRPIDLQLSQTVKAMAGRVLHAVAQIAIQVTGAISFTWEYPQHRYHRRGLALDQLGGGSADLIAGLGRQIRTLGAFPDLFALDDQSA
jgi:hypothetical protein